MARYIDVEGYRKLFDEEYKKTRKLISEGETYLDNLAEGFSEASRVIDRMPTTDVAPKSEVEELKGELAIAERHEKDARALFKDAVIQLQNARQEVAREIFEEIEKIVDNNTYKSYLPNSSLWCKEYKSNQIIVDIAELKKKYTGEMK